MEDFIKGYGSLALTILTIVYGWGRLREKIQTINSLKSEIDIQKAVSAKQNEEIIILKTEMGGIKESLKTITNKLDEYPKLLTDSINALTKEIHKIELSQKNNE